MSQTTLKMVSDDHMSEMMLAQPMRISDASSMMKRRITKNERPFTNEVYKCVNKTVDDWHKSVLVVLADNNGCIPAGRVESCLRYFLEGKQALAYQKNKEHLPQYSETEVLYWIDLIKSSSITELYQLGPYVLGQAWQIIYTSIVNHFAEKKWESVYSKSDDPAVWDKLSNNNPHLMNNRPLPFYLDDDLLKEIREKVDTILKSPVTVVTQ